MKSKLILTVILSIFILNAYAQSPTNKRERLERIKLNFIAKKLNLDNKTADAFWPIYNQYESEKQRLFRAYKHSKKGHNVSMNDIENRLHHDQNMLDLRKKYTLRFSKVLNPAQLANLRKAENEFRRMVIQKAKGGKEKYYKTKSSRQGA